MRTPAGIDQNRARGRRPGVPTSGAIGPDDQAEPALVRLGKTGRFLPRLRLAHGLTPRQILPQAPEGVAWGTAVVPAWGQLVPLSRRLRGGRAASPPTAGGEGFGSLVLDRRGRLAHTAGPSARATGPSAAAVAGSEGAGSPAAARGPRRTGSSTRAPVPSLPRNFRHAHWSGS